MVRRMCVTFKLFTLASDFMDYSSLLSRHPFSRITDVQFVGCVCVFSFIDQKQQHEERCEIYFLGIRSASCAISPVSTLALRIMH